MGWNATVLIAVRLTQPVKMALEKALADIDDDACGSHAGIDQAAQGAARPQRARACVPRQRKRVTQSRESGHQSMFRKSCTTFWE
jgi:hypothetical protein